MTIYDNAGKLQCRKMAWMKSLDWPWYTPFIDRCATLMPKWAGGDVYGYQHLEFTNVKIKISIFQFWIDNVEKRKNAEFKKLCL